MTAFASPRGAWRAFILALAFAAGTAQGSLLFGAVGTAAGATVLFWLMSAALGMGGFQARRIRPSAS